MPIEAPAVTGQKTIDLLLQAQTDPSKPAPKQAAPVLPLSASAPKAVEPMDQLKAAVSTLGVQTGKQAQEDDAEREQLRTAREQRRLAAGGSGASSDGPQPRTGAGPSLLDLPLIRYIRENRVQVIVAAVLMLAAVWGIANFSYRRRRD